MSAQNQLVTNLQSIYTVKEQIKEAIGTNSDILADYPSLIEELKPSGGYDIVQNGNNIDIASYSYVNVAVPSGGSGSSYDPYYDALWPSTVEDIVTDTTIPYLKISGIDTSTFTVTQNQNEEFVSVSFNATMSLAGNNGMEDKTFYVELGDLVNDDIFYNLIDIESGIERGQYDIQNSHGEAVGLPPVLIKNAVIEVDSKGNTDYVITQGTLHSIGLNEEMWVYINEPATDIGVVSTSGSWAVKVSAPQDSTVYYLRLNNGKAFDDVLPVGESERLFYNVEIHNLADATTKSTYYTVKLSNEGTELSDISIYNYITNTGNKSFIGFSHSVPNASYSFDKIELYEVSDSGNSESWVCKFDLSEPCLINYHDKPEYYFTFTNTNNTFKGRLLIGIESNVYYTDVFGEMTGTGR